MTTSKNSSKDYLKMYIDCNFQLHDLKDLYIREYKSLLKEKNFYENWFIGFFIALCFSIALNIYFCCI